MMMTRWYLLGIMAVVVVFVVLVTTLLLVPKVYGGLKNPSEFGEMFGAANAFFSGLAFAGVIFALLLQREDLLQQREDLVQQRAELLATQKLSVAGMLFEYYNAKISSLRTAQAKSEEKRQLLQPQVDELRQRHGEIRDDLEQLYAQLLARPGS